jgi:OOP family OmpA-OmpF porin/outer membrane immunogenic protein
MRNTLLSIAIAAAGLAAVPVIGHAADGGFFVNGNVGRSSLDEGPIDDHDTAFGANIGYRWMLTPGALIGIEGGYTDLGTFRADDPSPLRAKVHGWNLGANGHFNINPNWYVSARGGYFRADLEADLAGPDAAAPPVRVDGHDDTWYGGVGFGYDFSSNASVGLNYDYYRVGNGDYDANPSVVSVSAEYRY